MIINEIYDLNIFIDDANIFEIPQCILLGASIFESITHAIPTCSLKVTLPVGWINTRSIVDGTVIRFDIKSENINFYESLYFRLFNINNFTIEANFCTLELTGVLDFMEGIREANPYNLYGNSSDVVKNIAKQNALKTDIDNTNDTQLWIAGENNVYQFLSIIAQHGWINETSAMFWAFDRHKILLYKNLTSILRNRSDKIWTFTQDQYPDIKNKKYVYTNVRGGVLSGYENIKKEGYGGKDHYFDLLSYTWKEVHANKTIAESEALNLDKEQSKGLAQNWYSFDVGNFHKNYWLAKKQNARLLALYSTYVAIECQYLMNYRLGQIVNFNFTDARDPQTKSRFASGTFIIEEININITNTDITTDLKLVMQGINGQVITRETY